MRTCWILPLIAVGCLSVVGCSQAESQTPVGVRVRGKLQVERRPAVGAILIFHSDKPGLPPRVQTGTDGGFELAETAGLMAGQYSVTVEWRQGSDENGSEARSLVPDRYTRKEVTPLKAVVKANTEGVCDLGTLTVTR